MRLSRLKGYTEDAKAAAAIDSGIDHGNEPCSGQPFRKNHSFLNLINILFSLSGYHLTCEYQPEPPSRDGGRFLWLYSL